MVFVGPGIGPGSAAWIATAFTTVYHTGIKSNLYYVARPKQKTQETIHNDIEKIMTGDWLSLSEAYGSRILIAIPEIDSRKLRQDAQQHYKETIIGSMSFWQEIEGDKGS